MLTPKFGIILCFFCIFKDVDEVVASEVMQSVIRHLWYVTEELVIFALFDKELPDDVRRDMARKLRATQRPPVFLPGKPCFPEQHFLQAGADVSLPSLIGPRSWLLFDITGSNGRWLGQHPTRWPAYAEYRRLDTIIRHLEVVNDAAERGVKDIQEYADMAKDGVYRGKMQLVASSHRIKIPSFLKNEMEENM